MQSTARHSRSSRFTNPRRHARFDCERRFSREIDALERTPPRRHGTSSPGIKGSKQRQAWAERAKDIPPRGFLPGRERKFARRSRTTNSSTVPAPRNGGVYWHGDRPDGRDFAQHVDQNAIMAREILLEIFSQLEDAGWLAESRHGALPTQLVDEAAKMQLFEHARVGNLIEFGRVVHAEMNALVHAARRGLQVGDGRMYCTTFPCHVCARHIIGAGIAEVFYVEPYPKSLAVDLYPEAICLGVRDDCKVAFRPFTGVARAAQRSRGLCDQVGPRASSSSNPAARRNAPLGRKGPLR